jgi:WD40 repeat protein
VSSSDSVRVFEELTYKQIYALFPGGSVTAVAVDENGNFIAGAFQNWNSRTNEVGICLWNARTHEVLATLKGHTIGGRGVKALAFDGSGKRLVSGGGNEVLMWDTSTFQQLARFKGCHQEVLSVAFDRSGRYIASGSYSSSIFLFDTHTREEIAELWGHSSKVHSVVFDVSGKYLLSGSGDSTIRIWDVAS